MKNVFGDLAGLMETVESSRWLIGAVSILLPILSKSERLKIGSVQRKILENEYVDLLFIFAIAFSSTRSLAIALALTFVVHIFLNYIFVTDSPVAMLSAQNPGKVRDGKVTNKQIGDALDTLERAYHERQGPHREPWLL